MEAKNGGMRPQAQEANSREKLRGAGTASLRPSGGSVDPVTSDPWPPERLENNTLLWFEATKSVVLR